MLVPQNELKLPMTIEKKKKTDNNEKCSVFHVSTIQNKRRSGRRERKREIDKCSVDAQGATNRRARDHD